MDTDATDAQRQSGPSGQGVEVEDAQSLMLDGNAVAGLLVEVFGREMTIVWEQCDHCGSRRELGALHAYVRGPGIVLRCPDCQSVLLRIVAGPSDYWLDARGMRSLRLARQ